MTPQEFEAFEARRKQDLAQRRELAELIRDALREAGSSSYVTGNAHVVTDAPIKAARAALAGVDYPPHKVEHNHSYPKLATGTFRTLVRTD